MSRQKKKKREESKEKDSKAESEDRTKPSMLQAVVITFSDGTKASFTGPAVVFEDGEKSIADVRFTNPRPLPEDFSWGKV